MNNHLCLTCDRAKWNKTANGRLHPDGKGRCDWTPDPIPTPAAWYWTSYSDIRKPPHPHGGGIVRKIKYQHQTITACDLYRRKP